MYKNDSYLNGEFVYGEWGNPAELAEMLELSYEEQKAHVKKLWQRF